MFRVSFACILFVGAAVVIAAEPIDVPVNELGSKYQLVGKLHVPLGKVVTLKGVIVDGPSKGYEGGPNLRVQKIDGAVTQEDIQIQVIPYFGEFGRRRYDGKELPKLELGKSYELEGYESGHYVGKPEEAYRRAGLEIQTSGFYFLQYFDVYRAKQIEPVVFFPADFVGREALLEGKATNEHGNAYIVGNGWKLKVDPKANWPADFEGKRVEGRGTIRKADRAEEYDLEKGVSRLVRLEDQVGKKVNLRGRAWSLNQYWWFDYRGVDVFIDNLETVPGWDTKFRGEPIEFSGVLEEAMLPDRKEFTLVEKPRLKKQFIVRKATCKRLDNLLSPERVTRDDES
jgi:hypothetical protein